MRCMLIDPWLVELHRDDSLSIRESRYNSYLRIEELISKYSLEFITFLAEEFLAEFYNILSNGGQGYQRLDGMYLIRIIKKMISAEDYQGQAAIIDVPYPDNLPIEWLGALDREGSDDDAPHWRTPILIIPESRKQQWPNSPEIHYTSADGQPRCRNLICSELYAQHKHCEPDIDPWRIGSVGSAPEQIIGGVGERHESRRRLPRPPYLPLTLSYDDLVTALQNNIEWSCGEARKAYFIPHRTWDPRIISKAQWRSGSSNIFESGTVEDGRRGPKDREGRIWLWDRGENHHWDVQLHDGHHVRVSHTGQILS